MSVVNVGKRGGGAAAIPESSGPAKPGGSGGQNIQKPSASSEPPMQPKLKLTWWEQGLQIVCDGRPCKSCGFKDESDDPVALAVHSVKMGRKWGYPPKKDSKGVLKNAGDVCYYCMRTWEAREKHKISLAAMITRNGRSEKEQEREEKLLKNGTFVSAL